MFSGKPVIGVMPLYDYKRESYWMLPGYLQALEEHGAIALMLPLTDQHDILDYFLETCDGFLFTGGQDVDPALYGQRRIPACGQVSPLRDSMEQYILTRAIAANRALLGICRGLQLMNALYGGTLYQDLPTEYPSAIDHHMSAPYDRAAHAVQLSPDSPLQRLLRTDELPVNSYHHQGICELSGAFHAMAIAPDGLTEAIYMPDKPFVWGVQWHPEFSYQRCAASRKIFAVFVAAAKKNACSYF